MAKQNVVLPEALSTKPSPMMYPPPRVKPTCNVRVPNGGGGKISNCLFETMKVSSPTHAVAATAAMAHTSAAEERNNIWKANHPSALSMFKEIVESSNGKEIIMFLDYDGTLSPIVDDPDKAFMSEPMRAVVKNVAKCFPTAIVSGRCRDKVYNFVGLAELYYAGSHGMDIKGPANGPKQTKEDRAVLFQPASEFVPMIDEVYKILKKKTRVFEGAVVENNKFCLSVHYRCVDEKSWPSLADEVITVLKKYPKLKLTQGRKVLEIRPTIKWDKGKALEFLLESLGYADCKDVLPIYIGDDRTDEDAFKVLRKRGQGIGIIVSKIPKETNASYSLQEPSEVMDFLHSLVEWKRVSR